MPHGGYHGTVKIGDNVVQQGYQDNSGDYQVRGGIDDSSRLDFNPPQSNQNINQQVENKKKEIELLNIAQGGATGGVNPNIDQQVDVIDQGFFNTGITAGSSMPGGLAPGSMFPITGATGDTAKGLATLQNIKNQQLNNLLRQQQEENLANQLRSTFAKAGIDKADALRPLFTGDLGDKTFLGMNLGSTERPAATVINPFTGKRITTGKVREGMTSPEYAQYMSELYGLNPALMEETFPFGSGQIAKPILARIGEGVMGLPGASQIGQLASSVISPLSGLFTGQSTATPTIQYDNMGNPVGIISQLPESDGEGVNLQDFVNTPKIGVGQYSAIPEEYKGFFESEFAKPVAGGMAITYVTLPDGRRIRFGDTGSAAQFRKYLESIGVAPQEEPTEKVEVETPKEEKAPFDLAKFYAGLPNYSYGQQGVMNPNINPDLAAYFENLKKYYGVG
jgi:hypothetical protein